MIETKNQFPVRYEHSTFEIESIKSSSRAAISGAILLIGGLIALSIALMHIGNATTVQAVAWAFVVAAVIAALDRWA